MFLAIGSEAAPQNTAGKHSPKEAPGAPGRPPKSQEKGGRGRLWMATGQLYIIELDTGRPQGLPRAPKEAPGGPALPADRPEGSRALRGLLGSRLETPPPAHRRSAR